MKSRHGVVQQEVTAMKRTLSLSTDAVAAFVELARQGSLRKASENLFITEQGVRQRLLALEAVVGVELYRKIRGRRQATPLTAQGQQFLPMALSFLKQAEEMAAFFQTPTAVRVIHVVASQYLIAYVLIDAVRRFHTAFPHIQVRLSAKSEEDIEQSLLADPQIAFGVAAPYDNSPQLEYRHLFSMGWSMIAPPGHPALRRKQVNLKDIVRSPLVFYERGSTGRQHVIEALHERGLTVDVELEATNTDLIVRMVEAGLGVSIVPLLPSGVVTRGRRIEVRSLGKHVRPIHSGILLRRGETPTQEAAELIKFIEANCGVTTA
jgi:DNA-binding transcriptional LysR family regulator